MKTGTFFYRLVRFSPLYYLLELASISIYHLTAIAWGLIIAAYFNNLTNEPGALPLVTIILLLSGTTIFRAVSVGCANFLSVFFIYDCMALLHKNLLNRILQLPGACALSSPAGNVVNVFRDDVRKILFWLLWTQDLFGLTLTVIIAFIIMLRINPWITLGTFLPLGLVLIVSNWLSHWIERYYRANREITGQVTGTIGEMFGAVEAVQVANAEERVIAHLRQLNESRRQAVVKSQLMTKVLHAISNNTVTIGIGFLLLLLSRALQQGQFSVGDFALFVTYLWPVAELMRLSGNLVALYKESGVSVGRLQALMQDAPPTQLVQHGAVYVRGKLPELTYVPKKDADHLVCLEARGLTYHYKTADNNRVGIENIHLSLKKGTITVITGRVGSGKSTLLRVLLGLLPKDTGQILWNDVIVEDVANTLISPRVAYIGQVPRLFSATIRDNILFGLPEGKVNLMKAVKMAVLMPDLAKMENGIDTLVGSRGTRLSGGQIQRVAAARMFVREPELYVIDDLSSALDVETENLLWQNIFHRNTTVSETKPAYLIVSHRRAVLDQANRILVMKNGQILAQGILDELLRDCEEMRYLWWEEVT
jgi:ATP-binding cassette subfamily B protein